MPDLSLTFGTNRRNEGLAAVTLPASLWLSRSQRYLGAPGRGKTHALTMTALQFHRAGIGCFICDYKSGTMIRELSRRSDPARTLIVEPKSALDDGAPWHFNPIASITDPLEAVDATMDLFNRTHEGTNTNAQPRIEEFLSMATMLVAGLPDASFRTITDLLSRPDVRRHHMDHPGELASDPANTTVMDFWEEFSAKALNRNGETSAKTMDEVRTTKSRLNRLLRSKYTAALLDGPGNLDVMAALERGDMVLLDAHEVPWNTRIMVANIFVTTLVSQCAQRPVRAGQRPLALIIDELDLLAPEALIIGIERLREAGVMVVGAWQSLTQTKSRMESAFSSSAVQLFFQMYDDDAPELRKRFDKHYKGFAHQATTLPKGHALIVTAPDEHGDRLIDEIVFPPLPPPLRAQPLPPSHRRSPNVTSVTQRPHETIEGDARVQPDHQAPRPPDQPDPERTAPVAAAADLGDSAGDRRGGADPPRPADAQQADRRPALRRPTRPEWVRPKGPDGT